jgi:hypothetical protein
MTASETQRQLYQALKAHKSDLEITRATASGLNQEIDPRIEAVRRLLEWLSQALEIEHTAFQQFKRRYHHHQFQSGLSGTLEERGQQIEVAWKRKAWRLAPPPGPSDLLGERSRATLCRRPCARRARSAAHVASAAREIRLPPAKPSRGGSARQARAHRIGRSQIFWVADSQ